MIGWTVCLGHAPAPARLREKSTRREFVQQTLQTSATPKAETQRGVARDHQKTRHYPVPSRGLDR